MPRICLIRHTTSVVDPTRTADLWEVAPEGRSRASALVPMLERQGIDLIVTSPEHKARVTGDVLAEGLHLRREEAVDLSEQSWSRVPFLERESDFIEAVRGHFASPDEAVFGAESSREAALRFDRVVRDVLSRENPPIVPAFVSHGRIMSAWLATVTSANPFETWLSLTMPDAIMVGLTDWTWSRNAPPEEQGQSHVIPSNPVSSRATLCHPEQPCVIPSNPMSSRATLCHPERSRGIFS